MTDMRATERLLEVLEEKILIATGTNGDSCTPDEAAAAMYAEEELLPLITELRRRGDTLVRAEDLRSLLDLAELARKMVNAAESGSGEYEAHAYLKVAVRRCQDTHGARLENALGGRMR